MAMKLSTGKVAFPIEFDNGDKQNIYFNPNDPDLAVRLKEFQNRVNEKINNLSELNLNKDGEPEDFSFVEEYRQMQKIIYEEIDTAFGGDVSSVVFRYCSPFAIVGGEYFILQFLEAIAPEIEKHIKKANADLEKKMAKHISKYAK